MIRRRAGPLLLAALLLFTCGESATAQSRTVPEPSRVETRIAPVPFGPGERSDYQVRLGRVSVGEARMEVVGVQPVRGRRSYHVSWVIQGGIPLARVNDHYQSWFDIETLASRRFIQNIHQVRHRSFRHFEIFPEEGRWERLDVQEGESMATALPLDDLAFIYYVRSLPLEVGETYELDRYFRDDRNPVILEILRREVIDVPAGTFETIVVRPTIKAGGLFGEGGRAEVYFTDDDDRLLVRLTSRVPVVGSLSLHLTDHRRGTPLRR